MYVGSAEDTLGDLINRVDPNEALREETAERIITQLEGVASGLGFTTERNKEGSLGIYCSDAGTVWVAYRRHFMIWSTRDNMVKPDLQFRRYMNTPKTDWVGSRTYIDPETGLEQWEPGVDFLAREVFTFVTDKMLPAGA